jgi:hypothetical protein
MRNDLSVGEEGGHKREMMVDNSNIQILMVAIQKL